MNLHRLNGCFTSARKRIIVRFLVAGMWYIVTVPLSLPAGIYGLWLLSRYLMLNHQWLVRMIWDS